MSDGGSGVFDAITRGQGKGTFYFSGHLKGLLRQPWKFTLSELGGISVREHKTVKLSAGFSSTLRMD